MSTREQEEKKDRKIAATLSGIFFAGIIVLCFFLVAFTIPDPPPGEEYIAVGMADFGQDIKAGGDNETEVPSETPENVVEEESAQAEETQVTAAEEVVTQDASDVSVPTNTNPEPDPDPEPVEEEQQVSSGLSQAFEHMNTSGGGGSDGSTEGTGNEGDPQGDIDGLGVVQGDGIGFSLGGRGMVGKPKNVTPSEEGIVVLKIYVDRQGNVLRTDRDYVKSTTSSNSLFKLAEEAALTARFEVKSDAPAEQKGEMTFRFKLQ
ncbi:hypothetical protein [Sanyastnella coralliicola]|uniref:hypothetical protein n=1 Tax=Sanyastnella coralliicola TaxID=3069118 RepID=UPI0027B95715|nr:hypothetical protein [Longitalea sp. SCSIO 12813]